MKKCLFFVTFFAVNAVVLASGTPVVTPVALPTVAEIMPAAVVPTTWSNKIASYVPACPKCPVFVKDSFNKIDAAVNAHPYYTAAVTAALAIVAMKTVEYAMSDTEDDEDFI